MVRVVRVTMTTKAVTASEIAKGPHVDYEKKWTGYRTLRDTAESHKLKRICVC